MIPSAAQIDASIRWLLASASPPVRYLAHRDLLRTPPRAKARRQARADVKACNEAKETFARQRPDGANPRVAKCRLHHLLEDDWLTYWAARIAVNATLER